MNTISWINVQDELPEFNKRVFVLFYPKNPVMEGLLPGVDYRRIFDSTNLESRLVQVLIDNKGFNSNVAYWMEIPDKPNI